MIIRAIFWIGLIAFLMPHEPDLGYGRPLSRAAMDAGPCEAKDAACADHLSTFERFRAMGMRSLQDVRADIRAHRSHASI